MTGRTHLTPDGVVLAPALAGALAASALILYQVHRELGYLVLGLATSAFLLPRYAPAARRYWLPALAGAVPIAIVTGISITVGQKGGAAPTTGLAIAWAAACVAYPWLISKTTTSFESASKPRTRHSWTLPLLLIIAVGAFLRFAWLGETPAPFTGDEAIFAIQGFERAAGAPLNLFASGFHGSSTLYFQLIAWAQAAPFAPDTATRLLSAGFGSLAVLFTFLFLKEAFRTDVAVAGSSFLALSQAHIHFSRQAIPNIDDTLIAAAALYFTIRAIHRKDMTSFAVAGLVSGLAPYAWTSARILPVALAAMLGLALLRRPERAKIAAGVVVFAGGALLVAGPILTWWYQHPEEFRTREAQVAIFADPPGPGESWYRAERLSGESRWDVAQGQVSRGIDAVFAGPETSPHFNSEIGMFGPLPSLLILIGLALACSRLSSPVNGALVALFAAAFIGGALIVTPPASSARLLGLAVPAAAFAGIAATRLAALAVKEEGQARELLAVAIVVLAATPGLLYYFGDWRTGGRFSDTNTRIAAEWSGQLNEQLDGRERVLWFAAPPTGPEHPSLRLTLRNHTVALIGQDGKVVRQNALFGQKSPCCDLLVVATGTRVNDWFEGLQACAEEVPLAEADTAADGEQLVMFRPSSACSAALVSRYPPQPP